MVSALVSDYRQIRDEIQHTIELAEDKSDHSTADLYIALTEEIDKQIWMLSSFWTSNMKSHGVCHGFYL